MILLTNSLFSRSHFSGTAPFLFLRNRMRTRELNRPAVHWSPEHRFEEENQALVGASSQTLRPASSSSNQWQPRPSSRRYTGIGTKRQSEKAMIALLAAKRSHEHECERSRFEESLSPRPMDFFTVTPWAANRHRAHPPREYEPGENLATSVTA